MLINTDDRMAEICCGIASENEPVTAAVAAKPSKVGRKKSSSRAARRRRMEIRRFKFVSSIPSPEQTAGEDDDGEPKRRRRETTAVTAALSRGCQEAECDRLEFGSNGKLAAKAAKEIVVLCESLSHKVFALPDLEAYPKYGVTSVCGRRQEMEDDVAVHPFFFRPQSGNPKAGFHYCGVYDGHGCSHVAMRCSERLHELVSEELEMDDDWERVMECSFTRMDKEVASWNENAAVGANCRCEIQAPDCGFHRRGGHFNAGQDRRGSQAPKLVTRFNVEPSGVYLRGTSNLYGSRGYKPDRPDELDRIQAAGGRVIYWDGPRVLGVLGMSTAIGDNYLKPYVSCKPEVTVTERTPEDDCLIIASDGLWDVISNKTACGVAQMCLRGKARGTQVASWGGEAMGPENMVGGGRDRWDKACGGASMLLMKLALARDSTDNVSVVVVDRRRNS